MLHKEYPLRPFAGTNNLSSQTDVLTFFNKTKVYFDNDASSVAKVKLICTGTGNVDGVYLDKNVLGFAIHKNLDITTISSGAYGIRNMNPNSFVIDNSAIYATGGSNETKNGGIYSEVKPTLTGVFVNSPVWGEYNTYVKGYVDYDSRNYQYATLPSRTIITVGEDYGVLLCGYGVNSTNYSSIPNTLKTNGDVTSGTLSYVIQSDGQKYVLFDNAKIAGNNMNAVCTKDDATIIIKGTNSITQKGNGNIPVILSRGGIGVRKSSNSTVSELTITSESGVAFGTTSYINIMNTDINVTTLGEQGMVCGENLYVTNSQVNISSKKYAFSGAKVFTLTGSYTNDGTSYDTTKKYWINNSKEAEPVANIFRGYGIKVNGTDLTIDKTSVGNISYNASTNKLTINNSNISSTNAINTLNIYKKGLTIETTGTNSISATSSTPMRILYAGDVTITGSGTLDLSNTSTNNDPALFVANTNLNIEETTINAKSKFWGIYVTSGKLNINHSTVTANGTQGCIYSSGGSTLKDCEVTTPEGGKAGKYFTDKNGNTLKNTTCKITPADYDIMVAGIQVTSKNASKITGTGISGTVSYDRASKTLTLNNATITAAELYGGILAAEDLTINLIGTNNINNSTELGCCINCGNLTITSSSNGTLNCKSNSSTSNIYVGKNCTLNISNCTLNATGGKKGVWSAIATPYPTIAINNANVKFEGTEGAIEGISKFTLTNCYYSNPSNATFSATTNKGCILSNGSVCKSVQITAGEPVKYGIEIAGIEVTNANADDVLCDGGKVKYDNTNKILTLTNATINAGNNTGINIQNFGSTFRLQLVGDNKIKSAKYNGIYAANTTLDINGQSNGTTLDISTDDETTNGYSPILMYGTGKLTISHCSVTTNNKNYGIRANGSSTSTITLDGATINGNVTSQSVTSGALANFSNINLKNSTINSESCGIFATNKVVSINIDGTNEISAPNQHGIMIEGSTSNTSSISSKTNGSLDITATSVGHSGMMYETNLLVKDCKLYLRGYGAGLMGRSGDQTLTIDNASVTAKATSSNATAGAIKSISKLELKNGIQITSPTGAAYDSSLKGIAKDGALCKSVEIGVKGYSVKVDGKEVTSQNCNDILGDGKVKFNPETNTLTMNNATISSNDQALTIGLGSYTLDLIGDNTITGTNIGLAVALGDLTVTSSTGTGKLTCLGSGSGNDKAAIATALGVLTINNCTVEATNAKGIAINGMNAGSLLIKNANVKANGKEGCITDFTTLELEGCYIDQPSGAEISNSTKEATMGVYLDGSYVKNQDVVITAGDNPHTIAPTLSNKTIKVSNVTESSIKLTWTAAKDNLTPATKMEYRIGCTNKTTLEFNEYVVVGKTGYEIKNLDANTEYSFTMRAYDEDGNWAEYNEITAKTAEPDAIESILAADPDVKMYNTSGVLVDKNYRGIVIINGKKYIKK